MKIDADDISFDARVGWFSWKTGGEVDLPFQSIGDAVTYAHDRLRNSTDSIWQTSIDAQAALAWVIEQGLSDD